MEEGSPESGSLEYTPTWIVASVCFIIVFLSFGAERSLHRLGKLLKRKKQQALFEALQKLKEELMLLGFISLLLTVFQGVISRICIPSHLKSHLLPCKRENAEITTHREFLLWKTNNGRRLLSTNISADRCSLKGKVPLLSIEGLHQLHIFIFVLAVVHVIFCVTTMALGGEKVAFSMALFSLTVFYQAVSCAASVVIQITEKILAKFSGPHEIFRQRAAGYWRKAAIVSWMISFVKQFYGSVTKSDYIALRHGFIMKHCPGVQNFDFHKYMMRTLEVDFRKIVGISWYLWLFVILFLFLNVEGWNTYFWLSFLPLILLLLVGAKLEHIITRLAQEVDSRREGQEDPQVKPSDEHFWFGHPRIVLQLIHFILFQNSFEIAFFIWIWSTYGSHSCIMEKFGYLIPRLIMGVIVQVLCSYSTLPLYALVTQMGSMFKEGMFKEHFEQCFHDWADDIRRRTESTKIGASRDTAVTHAHKLVTESCKNFHIAEQVPDIIEEAPAAVGSISDVP